MENKYQCAPPSNKIVKVLAEKHTHSVIVIKHITNRNPFSPMPICNSDRKLEGKSYEVLSGARSKMGNE